MKKMKKLLLSSLIENRDIHFDKDFPIFDIVKRRVFGKEGAIDKPVGENVDDNSSILECGATCFVIYISFFAKLDGGASKNNWLWTDGYFRYKTGGTRREEEIW